MQRRGGIGVLEPGLLTTIQDLGRPGNMRHGVSPGGALDRGALILGNLLCGNDPGAGAIEITLTGPRLRFTAPVVVALTGADLGARIDGARLPLWQPVSIQSGGEITFNQSHKGRGSRAYLCVAGGIVVPPVLGSRSTDLAAQLGGLEGRALRNGDRLAWGRPSGPTNALLTRRLVGLPPEYGEDAPIRVVLGPQRDRFTKKGIAAFLTGPYTVSAKGDRMGVRLTDGPPISHRGGADLISEGIVPGSIQVPGDGQPIALLAACQTMGGYPKIATVIGADLDRLAQARPGDQIRFVAVEPAAARAATLAYRASLGDHAVQASARPEKVGAISPTVTAPTSLPQAVSVIDAWTPDGVIRVISALREAGLSGCQIALVEGERRLAITLGDAAQIAPTPAPAPPPTDSVLHEASPTSSPTDTNTLTAPMLGVFYRRPTPDEPPFAALGDEVSAGQTVGLIEVMKTFNEVVAPRDCTIEEFLVEDGAYVEYGQVIARIR